MRERRHRHQDCDKALAYAGRSAKIVAMPTLLELDKDTLAAVIRRCYGKDLVHVAETCMQLCTLARSQQSFTAVVEQEDFRDRTLEDFLDVSSSRLPGFTACTRMSMKLWTWPFDGHAVGAAIAAPGKWLGLQRLELHVHDWPLGDYHLKTADHTMADQQLSNLLKGLRSLPRLRALEVEAYLGPCSISSVGAVTQLTFLELSGDDNMDTAPKDLSPLRGLSNLVALTSEFDITPVHPAAVPGGGSCLPSSLQVLKCRLTIPEDVNWLHHLGGCPALQTVLLTYQPSPGQHAMPTVEYVVELTARHAPGLHTLDFVPDAPWSNNGAVNVFCSDHVSLPPAPTAAQSPRWWQPSQALAALTRLQQLRAYGSDPLYISTAADWHILGRLAALQSASGVHISCRPPSGLRLHKLEYLLGVVQLFGTDTRLVLAACPALRTIHLHVEPEEDQQVEGHGEGVSYGTAAAAAGGGDDVAASAVPSNALRYAELAFEPAGTMKPEAAAAHFAAVAPALAGVLRLALHWPRSSTAAPHLPELGRLTALTQLHMSSWPITWTDHLEHVPADDLLVMLQPLKPTLRVLCLTGFKSIPLGMVLVLQDMLPALQYVCMHHCDGCVWERWPLSPEEKVQLQQLKACLRAGLDLSAGYGGCVTTLTEHT
jgi:hypothetical protein